MAKGYRRVDRDQLWLFPPSVKDLLGEDHPVWLVITAVERHLDTSAFHAGRRTGGAGAAGYDPDMLVTLLVWAYANGVTSSRRIEGLCGTDAAFMAVCGAGGAPDHVTIARFRAGFAGATGEFFAQVLGLCAELGMGRLGVVALDGTKIAANASKSANRSRERLAELAARAVAAHGEADAAEDALFGPQARGDEVPGDAWSPRRRDERIAAALASLDAEQAAAGQAEQARTAEYLQAAEAGTPPPGARPAGADVAAAQLRADRLAAAQDAKVASWQQRNAAKIAATGTGLPERPPKPAAGHAKARRAAERAERARQRAAERDRKNAGAEAAGTQRKPVRNITDPDSRLMPVRGGGFIQGYNAQNLTSQDGLIIATEVTQDTTGTAWFTPMLAAAGTAAALITARQPPAPSQDQPASQDSRGAADTSGSPDSSSSAPAGYLPPNPDGTPGSYHGPIGLLLADAGYRSEASIAAPGPPRLIATGKRRDLEKAARNGTDGKTRGNPHTTAMAALLTTPAGIAAYRHRGHIAETPHGHIKHNTGFRQLTMRGLPKAKAEWTFTCATANIFKAITAGALTTQALTALTS